MNAMQMKWHDIEIEVLRKRVKYLRLRVLPDASVKLSVPWHTSFSHAEAFVAKNSLWLESAIKRAKARNESKDNSNLNEISYLGFKFVLIIDSNLNCVKVEKQKIFAPSKEALDEFMVVRAKKILGEYLLELAPLVPREIKRISFKKMSSRWGSCNTKKAYINLNLNLIKKRQEFARYVVLHELAHLLYPHHQKSFYDFIAKHMPDYKERIKLGKI